MRTVLALLSSPLTAVATAGVGGGLGAVLANAVPDVSTGTGVAFGALFLLGLRLDARVTALEKRLEK